MNPNPGTVTVVDSSRAVDIIIPVRNGERFIEACLDSVKSQSLQPRSVIVVDDGSTDGTPAILDSYKTRWDKLHIIRSEPRGTSHARNLGIAASGAPYIAFLDSDDIWFPEKLERQMSLFHAGTNQLGFVHCACIQIDELGKALTPAKTFSPKKRGDVLRAMIGEFYHISGSASAVVARRTLVLQSGGFDETLTCGEDLDLWLKLAHASHVDYVPEVLVALRVHAQNTCDLAVGTNPEIVFFQRIRIYSRWVHLMSDRRPILDAFREEALAVGAANVIKRRPEFGFYDRLKRSELELAQSLFTSRLDYYATLSQLYAVHERMKTLIARHLILRSSFLLRLCQRLGKFKTIA